MDIGKNYEEYIIKHTFGQINFNIDEDTISVLLLSVSKKRCGIGTSLAKKLEEFAIIILTHNTTRRRIVLCQDLLIF